MYFIVYSGNKNGLTSWKSQIGQLVQDTEHITNLIFIEGLHIFIEKSAKLQVVM